VQTQNSYSLVCLYGLSIERLSLPAIGKIVAPKHTRYGAILESKMIKRAFFESRSYSGIAFAVPAFYHTRSDFSSTSRTIAALLPLRLQRLDLLHAYCAFAEYTLFCTAPSRVDGWGQYYRFLTSQCMLARD
jgi:hypothetical protein